MLYRFVIAFLPRSFNFVAAVTIFSDFGAQENKICQCFHFSPICHKMMEPDAMILVCESWVLSQLFPSPLSLSSRGLLVPLCFLPSEWYHLHIWGCWYFSPATWIPAGASSSPAFSMAHCTEVKETGWKYTAWCPPLPIWNQPVLVVPCPVLAVDSWPAYRFLRRQGGGPGIPISSRIFSL